MSSSKSATMKVHVKTWDAEKCESARRLYELLNALPAQLAKTRRFPARYSVSKRRASCMSWEEIMHTPAIAIAKESQRSLVIFSCRNTDALRAVKTGTVRERTLALDASVRATPR